VPDTAYATCGDLSLAYQVFGDGPIDLVFAGSFVSHVELFWTLPEAKAFFDQLGRFCRVLLFDKAGVGLSDPVPKVRCLEDRALELEAVMDAAGFDKAVVFGISEGGPAAVLFAATRPERTRALVLTGTFAYAGYADWDDVDRDPAELRERLLPELGEPYTPTIEQIVRVQSMGRAVRSNWGSGEALTWLLPSVKSIRQLGMLERMSASPGMARTTIEATFRIDVRQVLPMLSVPTLVIHAKDDPVPVQGGRYLADHIPGARMIEVEGKDHAPWFTDPDGITSAIEEFLNRNARGTGVDPSRTAHRGLQRHGVLDRARRGDGRRALARCTAAIRRYHRATRRALRRDAGEEHGRRPPRDIRGPDAGDSLCRSASRWRRGHRYRDSRRRSHRGMRTHRR